VLRLCWAASLMLSGQKPAFADIQIDTLRAAELRLVRPASVGPNACCHRCKLFAIWGRVGVSSNFPLLDGRCNFIVDVHIAETVVVVDKPDL